MKTHIGARTAWLLIILGALTSLSTLWVSYKSFQEELYLITKENDVKAGHKNTSIVEVNFGNGKKRWFKGELGKETYPLTTALESVSKTGSLNLEIKAGKIYSVADIGGETGAWEVYYNNTRQEKPLDKLVIKTGDFYSLRFEKTK